MEEKYTIAEARDKLPSLVHSVEKGPVVTLTRHGKPVAVLLSIRQYEKMSSRRGGFWQGLTSLRHRMEQDKITLSEKDLQFPRDDSPGRRVDFGE